MKNQAEQNTMVYDEVKIPQSIKDGVVASLPMINEIKDAVLRQQVIDAWALALVKNDYQKIEDMPGQGVPDGPVFGNQAQHINGTTKMALSIVEIIESSIVKPLGVDKDLLLACGLVHDVGKPFEFSPVNQARWREDYRPSGFPALRHTLYGVYIALAVGLPESVAHVVGCHSPEGELVKRSVYAMIVHQADRAYWHILKSAGGLL